MTGDDVATLSYEVALGRLDELIARLERGDVDLEEMVGCYEQGARLAQRCAELLDRTEARVTQLVVGAGGVPTERPFDPGSAEREVSSAPRASTTANLSGLGAARPQAEPPRARSAMPSAPQTLEDELFGGLEAERRGAGPGRGAQPAEIDPDDIPF